MGGREGGREGDDRNSHAKVSYGGAQRDHSYLLL